VTYLREIRLPDNLEGGWPHDALESIALLRGFLENPMRYLWHL
jgi:hypothetical protein